MSSSSLAQITPRETPSPCPPIYSPISATEYDVQTPPSPTTLGTAQFGAVDLGKAQIVSPKRKRDQVDDSGIPSEDSGSQKSVSTSSSCERLRDHERHLEAFREEAKHLREINKKCVKIMQDVFTALAREYGFDRCIPANIRSSKLGGKAHVYLRFEKGSHATYYNRKPGAWSCNCMFFTGNECAGSLNQDFKDKAVKIFNNLKWCMEY